MLSDRPMQRLWKRGLLLATGIVAGCTTSSSAPEATADPTTQQDDASAPHPSPDASSSDAGDATVTAPAKLQCLARWYGGTPELVAGAWHLALPGGQKVLFDDGKVKTFDEAVDAPDLEDTLSIPYSVGPIVPIANVNLDPGRIRSDAFFKAVFGDSSDAIEAQLVDVTFVGQTVRFHPRAAAALAKVSTRLNDAIATDASLAPFVTGTLGGTFTWRVILNTNRLSGHSFGFAIDINVSKSNYWEWDNPSAGIVWRNQIPKAIVDAFEAEGFIWGGRWYHYDTMHFEYRPEMFDPKCRT